MQREESRAGSFDVRPARELRSTRRREVRLREREPSGGGTGARQFARAGAWSGAARSRRESSCACWDEARRSSAFGPAEASVDGDRVSCTYSIRGGVLTRREGGTLTLSQTGSAEVELRAEVTGYVPRLGATLGFAQQRLHAAISRRYFARLIAEARP